MKTTVVALVMLFVVSMATAADDNATERLVTGLSAADWHRRQQSAEALGASGSVDKAVIAALIIALNDDDSRVRRTAADALGMIGPKASKSISDRQFEKNQEFISNKPRRRPHS